MDKPDVYYEYGQSEATLLTFLAIAVLLVGFYKCFIRYRLTSKTLGYKSFSSVGQVADSALLAFPQKINISSWCCHELLRFLLCYLPAPFVAYITYITSTALILFIYDTYIFALNYIMEFRTARRAKTVGERYCIYRCFNNLQCLLLCPWVFVAGSFILWRRTKKSMLLWRSEQPAAQPEPVEKEPDTHETDAFVSQKSETSQQSIDIESDTPNSSGSENNEREGSDDKTKTKYRKKQSTDNEEDDDEEDDDDSDSRNRRIYFEIIVMLFIGVGILSILVLDFIKSQSSKSPSVSPATTEIYVERNTQESLTKREALEEREKLALELLNNTTNEPTNKDKIDDFFAKQKAEHPSPTDEEIKKKQRQQYVDTRRSYDWSVVKYLVLLAGVFVCGFSSFTSRKQYKQLSRYMKSGESFVFILNEDPGFQYLWAGTLMNIIRFAIIYYPIAPIADYCFNNETFAPFLLYYNYVFVVRLMRLWYTDKRWARDNIEYSLILKNRTDHVSKYMCPWLYVVYKLIIRCIALRLILKCPNCGEPARRVTGKEREKILQTEKRLAQNPKNDFFRCAQGHLLVIVKNDKSAPGSKYYTDYEEYKDTGLGKIYSSMR